MITPAPPPARHRQQRLDPRPCFIRQLTTTRHSNLPDGWVISARPAHQALVSEADFITVQETRAARGPAPKDGTKDDRRYLLAGLLTCGTCGRRMESAGSGGKAA